MSVPLRISPDEMLAGVIVATWRKINADRRRANGRPSRYPEHYEEERTWDQEIESTFAEIVTSRWLGVFWNGMHFDGTSGTDAGPNQVRWTEYEHGHLIVYQEDDPHKTFFLVTGRSPNFELVGWADGAEAMFARYWREDVKCPAWWMPQTDLHEAHG